METVHFWRGTDEQKAQRFLMARTGQFSYFDIQLGHPDWTDKKVLDFGGNMGDLLLDPNCTIEHQNYYCTDVIKEAIEVGKARLPQANWYHFNCYNCSFNPEGIVDAELPDMGTQFDRIVAYSVFTHTTLEEMHDLVVQLKQRLAPGGILIFSFIDPHFHSWPDSYDGNNLRWRVEKCARSNAAVDVEAIMKASDGAKWCTLIDDVDLYVNDQGQWVDVPNSCMPYHAFHSAEFMQQQFPDAMIQPPVNNEMQHCCIIRA